ncbi:MAG TPA: hypothetical protein VFU32_00645 [Ktedonobacterales bacterium]|nr:hypothetical protein [Ktedonobacterales bacterium]
MLAERVNAASVAPPSRRLNAAPADQARFERLRLPAIGRRPGGATLGTLLLSVSVAAISNSDERSL